MKCEIEGENCAKVAKYNTRGHHLCAPCRKELGGDLPRPQRNNYDIYKDEQWGKV